MKKSLLGLLILAGSTVFAGCDINLKAEQTYDNVTSENVFDYSAISGIGLLNNKIATQMNMTRVDDSERQEILDNLSLIESMMESGITKSEEKVSDREEYEKMYTLTVSSLADVEQEYTFYYNEILDDDDDDEKEYKINGLVILDGIEYKMYGEKEVEHDELEMEFKIALNDKNYVIIETEKESDEEEFEYTKYENGVKVFETSLEFEKDDDDDEFEYKFYEKTAEGVVEYEYEYETDDGEKHITVKKKVNSEIKVYKIKVVIDEDNNISYIFE